jgi:hypothetical protein
MIIVVISLTHPSEYAKRPVDSGRAKESILRRYVEGGRFMKLSAFVSIEK